MGPNFYETALKFETFEWINFIYSENATNKSQKKKIRHIFVAFSEYMNLNNFLMT